jgi:hypothetical protein
MFLAEAVALTEVKKSEARLSANEVEPRNSHPDQHGSLGHPAIRGVLINIPSMVYMIFNPLPYGALRVCRHARAAPMCRAVTPARCAAGLQVTVTHLASISAPVRLHTAAENGSVPQSAVQRNLRADIAPEADGGEQWVSHDHRTSSTAWPGYFAIVRAMSLKKRVCTFRIERSFRQPLNHAGSTRMRFASLLINPFTDVVLFATYDRKPTSCTSTLPVLAIGLFTVV